MTIFIILLIGFFLVWGWQSLKNSAKRQEKKEKEKTDPAHQKEVTEMYNNAFRESMGHIDSNLDLASYLRELYKEYGVSWRDHWSSTAQWYGHGGKYNSEEYQNKKLEAAPLDSGFFKTQKQINVEEIASPAHYSPVRLESSAKKLLESYKSFFQLYCIKNKLFDPDKLYLECVEKGCSTFESTYKINKIYAACVFYDEALKSDKVDEINSELGFNDDISIRGAHRWFANRRDYIDYIRDETRNNVHHFYSFDNFCNAMNICSVFSRHLVVVKGNPYHLCKYGDYEYVMKHIGDIPPLPLTPPPYYNKDSIYMRIISSETAYVLFSKLKGELIRRYMRQAYGIENLIPYSTCVNLVEQPWKNGFINN